MTLVASLYEKTSIYILCCNEPRTGSQVDILYSTWSRHTDYYDDDDDNSEEDADDDLSYWAK